MENLAASLGGFRFDNARRNNAIKHLPLSVPRARKTGTTIVGVVYKGGVVLGADTRATEGETVCDKNCEKIHYIAQNIWCCGAGTSADTESTTALISSQIGLHRLATNRPPRVVTALTMLKRMLFRYQGNVSAALVLGGYDCTGPSLYTVFPHGSTDNLPYVTMGSGSLAAMAVFESGYKDNLTLDEAKALVHGAITSGIQNDLGSGGNVDMMVINAEGNHYLRGYDKANLRTYRAPALDKGFPVGTTTVLNRSFQPISSLVTVETTVTPSSAMEVSS